MSIALYLACGGLLLLVLLLIVRPLLRSSAPVAPGTHDMEVYRDQLAELERDRARGLIGAGEADAARLEIERRLLAASKRIVTAPPGFAGKPAHGALLAMAVGLPLLSGALYLMLGHPQLPAQPFAARQADLALADKNTDVDKRVAEFEQLLAKNPKNLDALTGLGRVLFLAQRHTEAAIAYGKALDLAPDNIDIAASYAETLTFAAGGTVTDQARKLFTAVATTQPNDPRARFYLGLAQQQAGDLAGAVDLWLKLEADSTPDAPWMPMLRQRLEAAAKQANIDLAEARKKKAPPPTADKKPTTPGPNQDDIDAAQKMSPADRAAMIKGMVERLEMRLKEQPDDVEGWRRLGRSYRVMGEKQKAIAAFTTAAEKAPKNVDVLVDLATALLDAELKQNVKLPANFVKVIGEIHALDPAHPVGLFYMGQAADEAGNGAEAVRLWRQLLTRMPADAPIRGMLEKRIADIENQKK